MAFTVEFVRNTDGSCEYLATDSTGGSMTVTKLVAGSVFEAVETITLVATTPYSGEFSEGDGIYKFTLGASNIIISNDENLMECLKTLLKKVICEDDICNVSYFNSINLLTQTYWGLLIESYQGEYNFNSSELAGELITLSSINDILTELTTYCSLIEDSDSNCGCN